VLGPNCSHLPCDQVTAELMPLAKGAKLVQLPSGFQMDDAEKAATELLQRIGPTA